MWCMNWPQEVATRITSVCLRVTVVMLVDTTGGWNGLARTLQCVCVISYRHEVTWSIELGPSWQTRCDVTSIVVVLWTMVGDGNLLLIL